MHKLLIVIIGLSLAAALAIGIMVVTKKPPADTTPIENSQPTAEPTKAEDKAYTDPAGFSFDYPEDYEVAPVENEDSNVYSHLKISSNGKDGMITINVADSNFSSIDSWLKKQPVELQKTKKIETKLADIAGFEFSTDKVIRTVVIDNDKIIYDLELTFDKDSSSAKNAYQKIVSTFSFTQPKSASNNEGKSAQSDDSAVEEEEIIE